MRIFVDENIPQGPDVFSAYGEVRAFAGRALRREDLRDADALLVRSVTQVDAALLQGTPVRFVGTATIGVDHVDQNFLREAGIGFASAPGCNARSVAEYLVAALLHLHERQGLELEGQTLGIVGCGHVGSAVAALAPHLGLKLLRCDPPRAEAEGSESYRSLTELLEQSDIVTLHVPLQAAGPHATLKMANREFFERFRRPKTLINTARGEVTDRDALLEALDQGLIRHLVLDVFPGEPDVLPGLMRANLITPHVAGYSIQGKLGGTRRILEAFCRHFALDMRREVVMPKPQEDSIVFRGAGKSLNSSLHYFVTKSYDIARDDQNLREALKSGDTAGRFDALRRHYPERHEFTSFRALGLPKDIALRERMQGLGFFVD